MNDDFGYCEACGKRITGDDFSMGDAVRRDGKIFCRDCAGIVSAETNVMPAAPPGKKPSSRVRKHASSSRRIAGRRRPSTRKLPSQRRKPSSRAGGAAQLRTAQIQKLAASITCPYCGERLVVTITSFPARHVCDVCRRQMNIAPPR